MQEGVIIAGPTEPLTRIDFSFWLMLLVDVRKVDLPSHIPLRTRFWRTLPPALQTRPSRSSLSVAVNAPGADAPIQVSPCVSRRTAIQEVRLPETALAFRTPTLHGWNSD